MRVPVTNRVGTENDGWRVTQVTFAFERGSSFVSELVEARRILDAVAGLVPEGVPDRRELGRVAAELDALWAMTKRNVSQAAAGTSGDGALMIKLGYSEARQRLGDLCMRAIGRGVLDIGGAEAGEMVEERLRTLNLTIAAGTSQIQRNIIGERVLGLPREPRPA